MPKKEISLRDEIRELIKSGKINVVDDKGLKQGKWMKVHTTGKLAYEVFFKDDKPIGEYKRFHLNGKLSVLLNYEENSDFSAAEFISCLFNKTRFANSSGIDRYF